MDPVPPSEVSSLKPAMVACLRMYWWLPKLGRDPRWIACHHITGNALVGRGLAERYTMGKDINYRLTDKGLQVASILKHRRETSQR